MPLTVPAEQPDEVEAHVIVGGYGRSGKAAASVLKAARVPLMAVELNHPVFGDLRASGVPGVWGDITSPDILHAAQIEKARVLLLTMPDPNTIALSVDHARQANPEIAVVARAVQEHHVEELRKLGVDAIIQPEFEGGIEMVRQALVRYRCDDATTARLTAAIRDEFYGKA